MTPSDSGISTITLQGVLPQVFADAPRRPSDVWHGTLELKRGGRYMIEAASGTGKSSLCAYIYGARVDYLGTIAFDGTDVSGFSTRRWQALRRTALAYLPQELDLFPELTALDNIKLKNRLTGRYTDAQIMEMMAALGVDAHSHRPTGLMSIGQQQRVALIRAVCQPFSFILLDEPVSHLDEANNAAAAAIVEAAASEQGAAIVATSVGNKLMMADYKLLTL